MCVCVCVCVCSGWCQWTCRSTRTAQSCSTPRSSLSYERRFASKPKVGPPFRSQFTPPDTTQLNGRVALRRVGAGRCEWNNYFECLQTPADCRRFSSHRQTWHNSTISSSYRAVWIGYKLLPTGGTCCPVLLFHPVEGMQGSVMSRPVSVCLSVRSHNSKTTRPNFTNLFTHVALAIARSIPVSVAIRCVLPVLWITSCDQWTKINHDVLFQTRSPGGSSSRAYDTVAYANCSVWLSSPKWGTSGRSLLSVQFLVNIIQEWSTRRTRSWGRW